MAYDVGAIRHPGWAEAQKNPAAYRFDSERREWVRKSLHIHVGANIPGYLPENEPGCFDDRESATEYLRQELKRQQDYYFEQCEAETPEQQESGSDCCEWCSVALDVEAALSAIAASGPDQGFIAEGRAGWIFRPPHGPDVYHWALNVPDDRDSCEIAAEQDGE